MDQRQRLSAVMSGGKSDTIPWYADLSYLYSSMLDRGVLEERFRGDEGYLQFHRELGAGIYVYAPFVWSERYTGGAAETVCEENGTRVTTIKTPVGTVREVQKYMTGSCTWVITEHFVKELDDLRAMAYACEHRNVGSHEEGFRQMDELWGPHGAAVALAPVAVSPLQRLIARWAGIETAMGFYMDEPEELEAIFRALEEADDPIFDVIARSYCPIVEFPENLSAEITGRRLFEEFNAPYYKRRIGELHRAGKKVGIHNDGTLRGTFDLLGKCGFDFIEAVTPAPVGDIPPEKLREEAGPDVLLWGGLPGAIFSPLYSQEEFERCLQKALQVFRADGHCVLGVADQVPPDGLISRVKRVREAVDDLLL